MTIETSKTVEAIVLAVFLIILPVTVWSQSPYPPQAPYPVQTPMGPGGAVAQPTPPAAQQQQPMEYAFRPDLSNPEFGECLELEKNWRALWQRYAQVYQQVTTMNPSDPQYRQMALYAQGLKQHLDAAWNAFSGKCVYYPPRRQGQP
ncbi:MAG: hypothetical protein HY913_17505 [Desulfomonile tiedjei]|nr:hypothetical protein [Desulfomonile tiedjei]